MPRGSKIDRYGVGDEILALRQGNMGYEAIADAINANHPEIDKPLSHMCVKRWLKQKRIQIKEERLKDGDDLGDSLRATFRERLYDLDYRTNEIYHIMNKALKKIIKEGNNTQIIRAAKDVLVSINQSRGNWVSLMQFGINEFKEINEAKQQTTVNIDKLLIEISNELSPDARRELVNVVLSKEDKKMSDDEKKVKEEIKDYAKQ